MTRRGGHSRDARADTPEIDVHAEPPTPLAVPPRNLAQGALALQRQIGNRETARVLARIKFPWEKKKEEKRAPEVPAGRPRSGAVSSPPPETRGRSGAISAPTIWGAVPRAPSRAGPSIGARNPATLPPAAGDPSAGAAPAAAPVAAAPAALPAAAPPPSEYAKVFQQLPPAPPPAPPPPAPRAAPQAPPAAIGPAGGALRPAPAAPARLGPHAAGYDPAADVEEWAKAALGLRYRGEERGEGEHGEWMPGFLRRNMTELGTADPAAVLVRLGWTEAQVADFMRAGKLRTMYMTAEERARFLVTLGPVITNAAGAPATTSGASTIAGGTSNAMNYVMSTSGEVFVFPALQFHSYHSSALAGADVAAAGEISIDAAGHLTRVTNVSGHYRPAAHMLHRFLRVLKRSGHDISHTSVLAWAPRVEILMAEAEGGPMPWPHDVIYEHVVSNGEAFLQQGIAAAPGTRRQQFLWGDPAAAFKLLERWNRLGDGRGAVIASELLARIDRNDVAKPGALAG